MIFLYDFLKTWYIFLIPIKDFSFEWNWKERNSTCNVIMRIEVVGHVASKPFFQESRYPYLVSYAMFDVCSSILKSNSASDNICF